MNGPGKVTIENSHGDYISIHSETLVSRLVAMAKVKQWREVRCLSVPDDFLLGNLGPCLVIAGMRSRTLVD